MDVLLNEKERRVLSSLYRLQDRSVSQLAKETLINRTSLYPILQKLVEKGLVSAVEQEDKTIYDPIDPELFKDWLKAKREEAIKSAASLEEWIDSTSAAPNAPSLVSRIQYYEGFDGVKNLYADTWRNNTGKMIYTVTDVRAAVETMEDYFRQEYLPQRLAHDVYVKGITPEGEDAEYELSVTEQFKREMKIARGLFEDLGVEINIYDNKTAFVAYHKEKPCGVIIENETITRAMKSIFEYLWDKTN